MTITISPSGVLPVVLDPEADDPTNAQLNLNDGGLLGSGYMVLADPEPKLDPSAPTMISADSFDTEGAVPSGEPSRYPNREVTFSVRIKGADQEDLEAKLAALYQKLGKINREGGVLGWTTASGEVCFFDLTPESQGGVTFDEAYLRRDVAVVALQFAARPFYRRGWKLLATQLGSGSTVVSFDNPGGQVDALGKVAVTSLTADQWAVQVGLRSRYAGTGTQLEVDSSGLQPLGTSTVVTGAIRNTGVLSTSPTAIASSGVVTHKGSFKVMVKLNRPTANTDAMSFALEWGYGDRQNLKINDAVGYGANDREGVDTWADLGLVHIPPEVDRWEYRILAATASGIAAQTVDVKKARLIPAGARGERSRLMELSAKQLIAAPTSFDAIDPFNQTAGALAGKSLALGGTWQGIGDADDFTVDATAHAAVRTAVSDAADVPRIVTASGPSLSDCVVLANLTADTMVVGSTADVGIPARVVDINNYFAAYVTFSQGPVSASVSLHWMKMVGGTPTRVSAQTGVTTSVPWAQGVVLGLEFFIDAAGRYSIWWVTAGFPVVLGFFGQDPDLAVGGPLASGKVGLFDYKLTSLAARRVIDNFAAFTPTANAAIFAGRDLRLDDHSARRDSRDGTTEADVSIRKGRYFTIPPKGVEHRRSQLIVASYRNDPVSSSVPADDPILTRVYAAERGLLVPG